MPEPPAATGVLYGPKLHAPVGEPAEPSSDPGFGETRRSACGYFEGVVYDREWINFHHPEAKLCMKCFPEEAYLG